MDKRPAEPTIRLAMPADQPAMQRVIADGMRGCGYEICSHLDEDYADLAEYYRSRGGEFFVLEVPDAGVVGTVAIRAEGEDGVCVLRRMYLDEAYRGRGLGRRLLMAAMDWARGAGYRRMELETATSMQQAIKLYGAAGFTNEGDTQRFGRCGVSFSCDL